MQEGESGFQKEILLKRREDLFRVKWCRVRPRSAIKEHILLKVLPPTPLQKAFWSQIAVQAGFFCLLQSRSVKGKTRKQLAELCDKSNQ